MEAKGNRQTRPPHPLPAVHVSYVHSFPYIADKETF